MGDKMQDFLAMMRFPTLSLIDIQAILADTMGTMIGRIFLTVLYFTLGQKIRNS
jgi:hypothetical protein